MYAYGIYFSPCTVYACMDMSTGHLCLMLLSSARLFVRGGDDTSSSSFEVWCCAKKRVNCASPRTWRGKTRCGKKHMESDSMTPVKFGPFASLSHVHHHVHARSICTMRIANMSKYCVYLRLSALPSTHTHSIFEYHRAVP